MMTFLKTFPQGLSARIILLMTLALLPLGLISIYQTRAVVAEAQNLSNAALTSQTIAAAATERELIQQAIGAATALAASISDRDAGCGQHLSRFVDAAEPFIFAGFIGADGMMNCSSTGDVVDFSSNPDFETALNATGPTITMNSQGTVTGKSVVLVSVTARDESGPRGILTISIPHRIANPGVAPDAQGVQAQLRMASINMEGELVAASGGIETADTFLPADIPFDSLAERTSESFLATAGDGTERYFTVTPMIDNQLVLVGSWPATAPDTATLASARLVAIGFPILMWAAGIGVAYIGLQRLVVRHIRSLQSAMRKFALGDRTVRDFDNEDPPEELAEAGRAFKRMAAIITQGEIRQAKDLREKEILLKEIHHRVKNNLQLIASIMNMQSRQAQHTETRQMLASLQRRVRGLAMLHRSLYTTPEMAEVDAAEVVRLVLEDSSGIASGRNIEMRTDLTPIPLYPDQAVPLSMFVSEAVTNAIKHNGPDENGASFINVTLTPTDAGRFTLAIENSRLADGETSMEVGPDQLEVTSDGLGQRLMLAFVSQLDGETTTVAEDRRFSLTLSAPLPSFQADDSEAA